MKSKPKVIVILGQTAAGKSAYAVKLAKKVGGEVISADSRQVYKGLNLGTGKITKKEMHGVPHHLLDVANPKRQFSVSEYKILGEKAIKEILKRGHTPIVCGGTGFYIEALIDGIIYPEVQPNKKLRVMLDKKSIETLFKLLKKIDPLRAKTIDQKNKVRLVRAVEIAKALGKVPKLKKEIKYDTEFIGLSVSEKELKKRIHKRVIERLKKGMLNEARSLHKNGLTYKWMNELGFEYRSMSHHLQGKITKEEMISQLEKATWQYAKRQKTWFKRDTRIRWIKN